MSKIFNLESLININNTDDCLIKLNNPEESFFTSSMRFILNLQKETNENSKVLYKRILESNGDFDIVNESFSNFFNNVVRIIDKFIKFIYEMVDRFIHTLLDLVSSDRI